MNSKIKNSATCQMIVGKWCFIQMNNFNQPEILAWLNVTVLKESGGP
jgi:hypothetical protein